MSAQRSDNSQGDTGTRDITYDLISTSYHLLQGAETVALYIADAEQEGNQELAQFFREATALEKFKDARRQGRSASLNFSARALKRRRRTAGRRRTGRRRGPCS
jgi:hypothetical protein